MFKWFKTEKPEIQERDRIEIRLEAIGGQGAHSAGKILSEVSVIEQNYTANHFSTFGSEKRGTPVKSFVRISTKRESIRSASFIRKPNLLSIFHPFLVKSHPEIFIGVHSETDLIMNSESEPQDLLLPEGVVPRWIATVNATKIARQFSCGINVVMLGAMTSLLPEINKLKLEQVVERFFAKLSNTDRINNVRGFNKGLNEVQFASLGQNVQHLKTQTFEIQKFGYLNAPIGGIIINPGTSILKDHSSSRKGFAPKLNLEDCCHCGICDQVCPDFCFHFEADSKIIGGAKLIGLDYQYCKGCQKCIQHCPVEALVLTPEDEIPENEKRNFWLEKKI